MTLPLRKAIFWVHLVSGLIAGLAIAIMSFTGTCLAFEKELVAWSERDARSVTPPDLAVQPRPLDELVSAARAGADGASPSAVIVSADRDAAVTVAFGRDRTVFVDPYTAEVRTPASTAMHDTLHVLEDWHRWLALSGDQRPLGKLINGISNLAFFALAVTGLYIWWPRRWSRAALRPSVWFTGAHGKARDWNWHNVLGLWSAPVLIVLTLTALPISFRWAANGIYRLWGEEPPAQGGPPAAPAVTVPARGGAERAPYQTLVNAVAAQSPAWKTVTLRLGGPRGGAGAAGPMAGGAPREGGRGEMGLRAGSGEGQRDGSGRGRGQGHRDGSGGGRGAGHADGASIPAVSLAVNERGAFPAFATIQYSLDPYTGEVLRRETLGDASAARQTRMWTRFLHTGEAFGFWGKLIAGLASAAGVVLTYTGFALSYRRFFGKKAAAA